MKSFIITIDTEGDNLWKWDRITPVTTENAIYLPRFQRLCEHFGFKPVWLTNYEMINDPRYVDFISDVEARGVGELGMHLHAWNTPPYYELPHVQLGLPYLIEYPEDVMCKKVKNLTELIIKKTGIKPTSHRAGRWSMNESYFNILKDFGYTVDCSVTPYQSWYTSSGQTELNGTDYSNYPKLPYWIDDEKTLLEVPMSIRHPHVFQMSKVITPLNIARACKNMLLGKTIWFRPNGFNERDLIYLIDLIYDSDADYIMFMLHSSELMPGGSPTFSSAVHIESLYETLEKVFSKVSMNFKGVTLRNYFAKTST